MHLRHEVEQDVEHARLRRQRDRAVLRQRVRGDLAVHVLRAQPRDHHEHKRSRDAQPARQPLEELLGVARRPARQAVAVEDRGGEAGRAHEQEDVLH